MSARLWCLGLLVGCNGDKTDDGQPADTDTDADTDSDTDTDTDTDTDADTDSDTDADPLPTPKDFDANHVLVVPTRTGVTFLASDGSVAWERDWSDLVGACGDCGGEGSSADGDGLLLSFTTEGPTSGGAVARIDATGALEFRVDGFGFPHDAIRDPFDDSILIPEVTGSKITWIPGDGSSSNALRVLDSAEPDWIGALPNGAERFDFDGRSFLMLSHRGLPSALGGAGKISLWDISTATPSLVWLYPSSGSLDTPHGALYRYYLGQWWMFYAHTEGSNGRGTVGLAVTDDPTVLPSYVADLVPEGPEAPFEFFRGVEFAADGTLYLTDSRGGSGGSGRVLTTPFGTLVPTLAPTGATGAVNVDQVNVQFTPLPFADGVDNAFEAWLWEPTFPL
jgi:hypothetical protein